MRSKREFSKVLEISKITKDNLEPFVQKTFYHNWCGSCVVCSWQLSRILRHFNYNAQLAIGEYKYKFSNRVDHGFVIYNNKKIIDITSEQFDIRPLFVTDITNKKYIKLHIGKEASYDLRNWTYDSRPSSYRNELDRIYRETIKQISQGLN